MTQIKVTDNILVRLLSLPLMNSSLADLNVRKIQMSEKIEMSSE